MTTTDLSFQGGVEVSGDLVDELRGWLAEHPGPLTPLRVAEAARASGRLLGDATVSAIHRRLTRELVGAGPLDELLSQPGVTDVVVNGADKVYVARGGGWELTDVTFADDAAVKRLAQRLASVGGRRLDVASPMVDLRLPHGIRFHAVLAPVAQPGTLLSLRVPYREALTLDQLVASGMVPPAMGAALARAVQARLSTLISGGTGTGKTTLLAGLLGEVDDSERIVIVEDSSELRPMHAHVVSLETRPANLEGAGAIEVRALVKQALRMAPERLVVGEVRGAEVVDLLMALNTGHPGSAGTIHANSVTDVPARVEALAMAAGLNRDAVHSQLASGVDLYVHLDQVEGRRRVTALGVPQRDDRGFVHVVPALQTTPAGEVVDGVGATLLWQRLGASVIATGGAA